MRSTGDLASAWVALASCQCILLAALLGCGSKSVKTRPVKGRVEIKDGDVSLLAGSHVELMAESDPLLRPNGKIDSSGAFAVETLYQGKIVAGAPEGTYKARIILADESDAGIPKRKGNPIHQRFLDFAASGLS